MAKKQAYNINRFEGGLNNALHPSKIQDDELAELLNLVIKAGSIAAPPSVTETVLEDYSQNPISIGEIIGGIKPGTGLYYFRSDFEMLDPMNGNPDTTGYEFLENPQPIDGGVGYWVVVDNRTFSEGSVSWIWIFDTYNKVWSSKLQGKAADEVFAEENEWQKFDINFIGEALRICETEFARNNTENSYRGKIFKRRHKYLDRISNGCTIKL